jgi:hypothetical protein
VANDDLPGRVKRISNATRTLTIPMQMNITRQPANVDELCCALKLIRPPTIWPAPKPQYQMPYRSGASALMYHREVKTIKAGAMIASHIPKRVRTAMIEAVSWHVAEQQRMIPHSKMLYPRTFETGKFWRSIPARLSSASDDSDGSYIVTLRPFSDNIADEECCCCPREVLTLHMEVFLQTHDIRVLH